MESGNWGSFHPALTSGHDEHCVSCWPLRRVCCLRAALPMAPDFSFEVYQGEQELGGRELRLSDVVPLGKPIILNF